MSFTLTLDDDAKLIRVDVEGLLNNDLRKDILSEVSTTLIITKYEKVLIDLLQTDFDLNEPMTKSLQLVKFLNEVGITKQIKLAFLYSGFESYRKHFEKIAQSLGQSIRYFKSRDDALFWLLHSEESFDSATQIW